jgi:hypothetical protein
MVPGSWKIFNSDGSISTWSGILFHLHDYGNANLQNLKVTGPGLPSGGIAFSKPNGEPVKLFLNNAYQTSALPYDNMQIYVIDDDALQLIPDNALYTFTFFASDGVTVVETRTAALPRRPLLLSELNDAYFPTLGVTSHALSAADIGGTLTFSYAPPVAGPPASLYAEIDFWNNTQHTDASLYPLMTETSASIAVPGASGSAPTGADLDFEAQDAFWRTQSTVWMYQ